MDEAKKLDHEESCRDGSFVVIFCLDQNGQIKVLMGKRSDDGLWEYLGGGFEAKDFTAKTAVIREVYEEAGLLLNGSNKITLFAVMTQKLPESKFGAGEKGHAFYFMTQLSSDLLSHNFNPSDEHSAISWHSIGEILTNGENLYKTAALRITLRFLIYLKENETQVGVLAEKVEYLDYKF